MLPFIAIYYDPSPKYFAHQLPPVLNNLNDPVLTSFTHNFGDGSGKHYITDFELTCKVQTKY